MLREGLLFVGTCDIAGHVRGKGFPASVLAARRKKGIDWTHSNLMHTAFGPIFDTPFGTGGDLMIVPDPSAEVHVDFADGSAPEHFFLGDIENTDGTPWECCPREFLRRAIDALTEASGLKLIAAFEHEGPKVPFCTSMMSSAAWRLTIGRSRVRPDDEVVMGLRGCCDISSDGMDDQSERGMIGA